jgi:hypothetical protein
LCSCMRFCGVQSGKCPCNTSRAKTTHTKAVGAKKVTRDVFPSTLLGRQAGF